MRTIKQTICFIILITFIAFSCKNNQEINAKDVTITLEVKAMELFNETNPDKQTIEIYCSLDDGLHVSDYGKPKMNFETDVYNTKFVHWASQPDSSNVGNGYSVEITHIVRKGTPIILNKNVITRTNGKGKLKAKVTKNKDNNEYTIYFIIISPNGNFKAYTIDPILKANPK